MDAFRSWKAGGHHEPLTNTIFIVEMHSNCCYYIGLTGRRRIFFGGLEKQWVLFEILSYMIAVMVSLLRNICTGKLLFPADAYVLVRGDSPMLRLLVAESTKNGPLIAYVVRARTR